MMYKNDSTGKNKGVPIEKFARRQSRLVLPSIPDSHIIDSLCNSLKTGTALDREPKEHALITAVTGNYSVLPILFSLFIEILILGYNIMNSQITLYHF